MWFPDAQVSTDFPNKPELHTQAALVCSVLICIIFHYVKRLKFQWNRNGPDVLLFFMVFYFSSHMSTQNTD